MSQEKKSQGRMSRREMLKALGAASAGAAGAGLLAGCKPAATPAPAATKAPAAAPTITPEPKKLTVWMAQSFTTAADEAVQNTFQAWADKNGVTLEYDLTPSAQLPERLTPAIEAKATPDLCYFYESQTQWYRGRDVLLDVTDVVKKYENAEGGIYDAVKVLVSHDNKYWAMPVQINPWPMHARQDLLDKAGGTWPATWDEFAELCKQVQSPPDLYGFGMCLGRNNDANNNMLHVIWSYGGQLTDAEGSLDLKSDGTVDALKKIVEWYNDGIIPPGSINWDNAGNNKAYQSRQAAFVLNPSSVLAWCQENDKELEGMTELYNVPAGPAGSFGQIDAWGIGLFKFSKSPELAKDALSFFMDPTNYGKYITAAQGRAVPIYKDLFKLPVWGEYPKYKEYPGMAETGRMLSWAGAPTSASGDVLQAYILPDMVQRCVVEKWEPQKALDEAYDRAKEIYAKYGTKTLHG